MRKLSAVVVLMFVLCLSVFSKQSGAATPKEPQKVEMVSQPAGAVEGEIDQKNACHTDYPLSSKKCIVGHKIYFQNPNRKVGSPASDNGFIMQFVANNCDLRYQIAHTDYGVVCIFLPVSDYVEEIKY
jgi:hypothetical protein